MIRLILVCLVLSFGWNANAWAEKSNNEKYFEILARKTIDDFQKSIERYNAEKSTTAPKIKKRKALVYEFQVKNNAIRFSITSYLNNEIFLNGKSMPINTFGTLKKTTWMDVPFISHAVAAEGNPDAESTRIILTALGAFAKNLEDVGTFCFASCVKEKKENNLKKILKTLETQYEECSNQASAQTKSMEVSKLNNMVNLLHSISDPEFVAVKKFFQKISETNKKAVDNFMRDKFAVEKKYEDCIGIMTFGTMADMQKALEEAKGICLKIDQLKGCTLTIRRNVAAINRMKRESKRPTAVDAPIENLPNIHNLAK